MAESPPEEARLRWQCRRGMLELDFVLERYLDECFTEADAEEKRRFADLLQAQDPELQVWLLNGEPHPDPEYADLVSRIRRV